jgi:hypothetical protein
MYDQDKDRILHLYDLGVPLRKIIETHIKYGKYASLKEYIDKRKLNDSARFMDERYFDLN